MKNTLGDEITAYVSEGFIEYAQFLVGNAAIECVDLMKDHITISAWNYEKGEPVNIRIKFEG